MIQPTSFTSSWRRVRRGQPCPVCRHPDWCAVSADGAVALCQRVESARRVGEAGWLHRLTDSRPRATPRSYTVPYGTDPVPELRPLAEQFRAALDPGRLHQLAASLGLSEQSLQRLGVGWAADHGAWTFPMAHADGHVVGIRLRFPNGRKLAIKGSKEGLFLPDPPGVCSTPRLLVCEGPTDTAALLDLGLEGVAGRPSCTGGIKQLVEVVRRRRAREVVIVADADEPGQRGAHYLATVLTVYSPAVRVIQPPPGVKDARDWLRAGGTAADVERAIAAAPVRRLAVRTRGVQP